MKVGLTGHRRVNEDCIEPMKRLLTFFEKEHGSDLLAISGGNLGTTKDFTGADRLWALAAFELDIPYKIIVPPGYGEHYYKGTMKDRFDRMLDLASEVRLHPSNHKNFHWTDNFARNTAMVEEADLFVVCSILNPAKLKLSRTGGTAHCCREISKKMTTVYWINARTAHYMGEVEI